MPGKAFRLSCAALTLLLTLGACGGGGDSPPPQNTTPQPQPLPPGTVGTAGGTVTGPSGAQVVIPAGALSQNVTFSIAQSSTGAPALPAGYVAIGQVFEFTPHDTTFATSATVTVPFDPAQQPTGQTAVMLKTNAARDGWEPVTGVTVNGNLASAQVSRFSWIFMSRLPPPVEETERPVRYYRLDGIDLGGTHVQLEGNWDDIEIGEGLPDGEFTARRRIGDLPFVPPGRDEHADGEVFSTEDGHTYWVDTEAPSGDLLAQIPEETFLGSRSMLRLDQSYRKNAADATLELVVTEATMTIADLNAPGPRLAGCPWSGAPENTPEDCNDLLSAELIMDVYVLQGSERTRHLISTHDVYQTIYGSVLHFHGHENDSYWQVFRNARDEQATAPDHINPPRRDMPWQAGDFEGANEGGMRIVRLRDALRIPIDLSRIPTCSDPTSPAACPEFTVRTAVTARTNNRRAGETYANARLRDPITSGGMVLVADGVTATNAPLIGRVSTTPPVPPACSEGSHPDAGTVEFSADEYRILESLQLQPRIFVVRLGGARGELAVNVTARDGTARAGTHYSAFSETLIFKDGDAAPRAISLPTINRNSNDGNLTLQLELSAQPGCATLGDPATAEVTIVDVQARPPVITDPSGSLDTAFDGDGRVTSAPFGGPLSRMILQPDGKLVMVGGTFTDFVLARFNADGSADTSFGSAGRVTTDIAGGSAVERARAVALQSDGKIVVAGDGALPNGINAVALARYNPDGTLDSTFSVDGKVHESALAGQAWSVAIQPDGRILIAGSAPVSGNPNDLSDMLVARFNTDGSLDSSFGNAGSRVVAVTARSDLARNLVLLPDGSMVAAGDPLSSDPAEQTGVLKLDAAGNIDGTFGSNGRLSILGARVGRGLARQSDGKLLLVGGTTGLPSSFAVMRLNADGSADSGFGNAGAVTTAISNSTTGEGDIANAVAVTADGRIYVAGVSGSINRNFALARYTSGGVLDTSFAGTGFVSIDFGGLTDIGESVVVQNDTRIVVGGSATPTSSDGYGLVRINP